MSARATDSGIRLEPPSDTPRDVPLRPVAPRRVGPLSLREAGPAPHAATAEACRINLTLLGWGWPVVRQLAQLAVLVFIFGQVLDLDIENYPVFVFVGLMAWRWFSGGLSRSYVVLGQRHLVMQPRLPSSVLSIVAVIVRTSTCSSRCPCWC